MPLQVKPIGAGCNQKLPSVKKDYRDIAATLDTGEEQSSFACAGL